MGPMLVVLAPPFSNELAYLLQASKQVKIEQLVSQAAVKAFNEGILVRLTGLDIVDKHPIGLAPFDQNAAEELRSIIDPEQVRQSSNFFQAFEHAY